MRSSQSALVALGALCWPMLVSATPAHAAVYVLGDSLGEGVAEVAKGTAGSKGAKGLAKISIHIRGPKALQQIAQTPPGSTAFLVLGTNDAEGSIARLDKSINDIVTAAEKKNITLVWMGPPCVRKAWDSRARQLDAMLHDKLATTSVRYVSMRDAELCSGAFHEPDGVHLKMKGYAHMWDKARGAAGFALASVDAAPDTTGSIAPRAAAPKKIAHIPLPVPRRPLPGAAH